MDKTWGHFYGKRRCWKLPEIGLGYWQIVMKVCVKITSIPLKNHPQIIEKQTLEPLFLHRNSCLKASGSSSLGDQATTQHSSRHQLLNSPTTCWEYQRSSAAATNMVPCCSWPVACSKPAFDVHYKWANAFFNLSGTLVCVSSSLYNFEPNKFAIENEGSGCGYRSTHDEWAMGYGLCNNPYKQIVDALFCYLPKTSHILNIFISASIMYHYVISNLRTPNLYAITIGLIWTWTVYDSGISIIVLTRTISHTRNILKVYWHMAYTAYTVMESETPEDQTHTQLQYICYIISSRKTTKLYNLENFSGFLKKHLGKHDLLLLSHNLLNHLSWLLPPLPRVKVDEI